MLPSPASKVTLTRPVGTVPGFAGFGTTTFAFTVKASVSAFKLPFVNLTAFALSARFSFVSFAGAAVIP